jgi:hypothetical protein
MSQQVEITESQFAEAIKTVQAFLAQSPLQMTGVSVDIGGAKLDEWTSDKLAKFDKVHINLTIELRNPEFAESNPGIVGNNLVGSSLFGVDPETYYKDVVANLIKDITLDQEFYQIVEDFIEQTVQKALNDAQKKSALEISTKGGDALQHYNDIVKDVISDMKKDPALRNMFNSQVSQMVIAAVQNPEFLAKSRLIISRQFNNIATSRALVNDEDYAQASNNYLQLQLDDIVRNIQISIMKDIQNNSLKIPSSGFEMEQYIRSKIVEQQDALRSKIQLHPSQQIQDMAQIKTSMLDILNNDEKLNQFLNGVIQSKINYAIHEAKKQGHVEASLVLQNDPSISQVMNREINEYITQLVMANLASSQLLVKSQVVAALNQS